ncbi:MAG: peptidoglycan bridge formation glycyltransferase FemA/FemB family protein [bacterium]
MEITGINGSNKEIFNNFLIKNNGCFLQSFEWGEFKKSFGYWDISRLTVSENGEINTAFTLFIRKIPYTGKTFFYVPRGPVFKEQNINLYKDFFDSVKKLKEKYKSIFLKIEPEIEGELPLDKKEFLVNKKHIQPRCTIVIDLKKDTDTLFAGFENKTRYNIRIAQKKAVEITKAENKKDLAQFFAILDETSRRKKFLIHSKNYYEKLWDVFHPANMVHLFLASYQKTPVAGLFIMSFGGKIWYLYGASRKLHREVMPNQLLHWEVIKWAKSNGFKEYDLWGIPYVKDDNSAPPGNHPLYGVWRFKKGFGGRIARYPGTFDIPYSSLYYNLFEKGLKTYFKLRNISIRGETKDALQD